MNFHLALLCCLLSCLFLTSESLFDRDLVGCRNMSAQMLCINWIYICWINYFSPPPVKNYCIEFLCAVKQLLLYSPEVAAFSMEYNYYLLDIWVVNLAKFIGFFWTEMCCVKVWYYYLNLLCSLQNMYSMVRGVTTNWEPRAAVTHGGSSNFQQPLCQSYVAAAVMFLPPPSTQCMGWLPWSSYLNYVIPYGLNCIPPIKPLSGLEC